MKRSKASIVHNGLLLALAVTSLGLANPANADSQTGCSTATLKGNYIYAQDGFQNNARKPFAQAGRENFDGNGNMSGVFSGNFNGTIVRGDYAGTYTVNPDCSGSVTFTDDENNQTSHFDIYVADDGNEFAFVQTDPNSITADYERRRVSQ